MFQKDVVAPGRMRRKIRNPRILLLDCPLEYKKGENQTNVEIEKEEDWYVVLWQFLLQRLHKMSSCCVEMHGSTSRSLQHSTVSCIMLACTRF